MSTVLLSTIPGHAPVLMGAFPEQIVKSSIFSLIPLTTAWADPVTAKPLLRAPLRSAQGGLVVAAV